MAVKFYPPILEGTLPSFIKNRDGTVNLTVPFSMNAMVAVNEVDGLILRIKTTTTNAVLTTTKNVNGAAAFVNYNATFKLTAEEGAHLVIGQSYKFQLAYYKNNQVGYYSNLAIIKCTDEISVSISNLYEAGRSNINIINLVGKYANNDTSEKVYQYQFSLYNTELTEELENSGWLNHNVYADSGDGSSIDEYEIKYNMRPGSVYKAKYTIRTNTYKEVSSKFYPITAKRAQSSVIVKTFPEKVRPIVSKLNFDNAYIKVKIGGREEREALEHLYRLAHSSGNDELALQKNEIKLLAELLVNDTNVNNNSTVQEGRISPQWARDEGNRYIRQEDGSRVKEKDITDPLYNYSTMQRFVNSILAAEKTYNESESPIYNLIKQITDAYFSGTFILERSDSNSHFTKWERIWKKDLDKVISDEVLFTDYLIEQGVIYLYSLRQINNSGVYSERDLTDYLTADYEDTFLYDGHRQLRLRFNVDVPKLSRILSEQKKNMIGSKYPFIFRNGVIDYKEFQLKGMMTAYNDNDDDKKEPWDELRDDIEEDKKEKLDKKAIFIDKETINKLEEIYPQIEPDNYKDSSQKILDPLLKTSYFEPENQKNALGDILVEKTSYKNYRANSNIDLDNSYVERVYKLTIWHWLSDGKVKLFKSSQEGCYLIRLLNVSISPSAKLGGLIHSFDAQAEEIGNLIDLSDARYFGLLPESDIDSALVIQNINTITFGAEDVGKQLNNGGQIYYIKIPDAIPGTMFELTRSNGNSITVMVGATGVFELDVSPTEENYYVSIKPVDSEQNKALLAKKGNNNQIIIIERSAEAVSTFDEIGDQVYDIIPAMTVNVGLSAKNNNVIDLFETKVQLDQENNTEEEQSTVIEIAYAKFMRMDVLDIDSLDRLQEQAELHQAIESMVYAVPNDDGTFHFYRIYYAMPLDWPCLRKIGDHLYQCVPSKLENEAHLDEVTDSYYIIDFIDESLDYSCSIEYAVNETQQPNPYNFDLTYQPEIIFDGFANNSIEKKKIKIGNGVMLELGMSIKTNVFIKEQEDAQIAAAIEKKNAAEVEYLKVSCGLIPVGETLQEGRSYIYLDPNNPVIVPLFYGAAINYDTDYLYISQLKDLDYLVINQKFAEYEKARMVYQELLNVVKGEGD